VSEEAAGQYPRGSGSHQHMRKNPPHQVHDHQHYVPKKIQPAPGVPPKDQNLLREKELLQDREYCHYYQFRVDHVETNDGFLAGTCARNWERRSPTSK
jgi:hypothetical protein